MERTDEEVMMDYQAGDETAIHQLFHRYKVRMLNFCFGLLGNRADAEEVAGDVFLAVVTCRQNYRSGRKLSTWVYTIARNKCVDRLRRKKPLLFLGTPRDADDPEDAPALDPADSGEAASDALKRKETAACVRQALMRLPREQREAVILQHYHDCSYEQISEILRCSLANVKILIFRGKERLRAELASFVMEGN